MSERLGTRDFLCARLNKKKFLQWAQAIRSYPEALGIAYWMRVVRVPLFFEFVEPYLVNPRTLAGSKPDWHKLPIDLNRFERFGIQLVYKKGKRMFTRFFEKSCEKGGDGACDDAPNKA